MLSINEALMALYSNGTLEEEFIADGFGPLLSLKSQIYLIEDDDGVNEIEEKSNISLIIGISLGASSLLIMILVVCLYFIRKRAKVGDIIEYEGLNQTEAIVIKWPPNSP